MAARHDLLAQIGANRRRTIYMMAGFTIFVAGVAAVFDLAFAGGPIVLAVAIVVALAMVWTGYFYSDRVAIATTMATASTIGPPANTRSKTAATPATKMVKPAIR